MDSTKRILKFQTYDLKKSILSFWAVMIAINIFASTLTMYSNANNRIGPFISHDNSISFAGSNIMAIFIFFIVYGIVMYHEYFALALSFGVTRRDFYKSVIIDNTIAVLIFAIIQAILQIIDKYVIESLGYKPMVEFGLFNTLTDNILFIAITLFTLFLALASMTNLLGVLQYRFGYKLWIGIGIIFVIGEIFGNIFSKAVIGFSQIYLYLGSIFNNSTILILELFITIICYTLGFLFISKANIKK